jgi:hypothetical protein
LFAVIFYTLRELFLNETTDSPRRRSLRSLFRKKVWDVPLNSVDEHTRYRSRISSNEERR